MTVVLLELGQMGSQLRCYSRVGWMSVTSRLLFHFSHDVLQVSPFVSSYVRAVGGSSSLRILSLCVIVFLQPVALVNLLLTFLDLFSAVLDLVSLVDYDFTWSFDDEVFLGSRFSLSCCLSF